MGRGWLVVVVILGCVAFVATSAMSYRGALQEPTLGVTRIARQGNDWVVANVYPASAAWDAGVRPGYQVLAVNGQPPFRTGSYPVYSIVVSFPKQLSPTTLVAREFVPTFGRSTMWLFIVLGFIFLLVGSLALLQSTTPGLAVGFFAFALLMGLTIAVTPAVSNTVPPFLTAFFYLGLLTSAALLWFLLRFPRRIVVTFRGVTSSRFPLLGPVSVIGLLLAYPLALINPSFYNIVQPIAYGYFGVSLLLAGAILVMHWLAPGGQIVAEQTRLLAVGLSVALLPLALGTALPKALGAPFVVPAELTVLFLVLLPLSFAFAFMRYQLMGVRRFVHRGVVYGLSWLAILASFGLVFGLLQRLGPAGAKRAA